jgi:hypothetical protein
LDPKTFKKIEKNLATVKGMAKLMANYLKSMDAEIPDATEYSKFIEWRVIEKQYFRTGFYWCRPKANSGLTVLKFTLFSRKVQSRS